MRRWMAALAAERVDGGLGGLGQVLADCAALAELHARMAAQIARRIAVLEASDSTPMGAATLLTQAGWSRAAARSLRTSAVFAGRHSDLQDAWSNGSVRGSQVAVLSRTLRPLAQAATSEVVGSLLPVLADLSDRDTRVAAERAVELLGPQRDADEADRSDYAARTLSWSILDGGLTFTGYLPPTEAAAFTSAIDALVEDLRVSGDHLTRGQRRADALAALVSRAVVHGLPTAAGLPATATLTVSLPQAERAVRRGRRGCPGDAPGDAPGDDGPGGVRGGVPGDDGPGGPVGGRIGQWRASDPSIRFILCSGDITPVLAAEGTRHGAANAGCNGPLLDRLLDAPLEPLAVGRAQRLATPAQRKALQVRDGGCVIPDCAVDAAYTQPHHVQPWGLGGLSDLDNLASLCWVHHRHVEQGRWDLRYRERVPDPDTLPAGSRLSGVWWVVPPEPRRSRARSA